MVNPKDIAGNAEEKEETHYEQGKYSDVDKDSIITLSSISRGYLDSFLTENFLDMMGSLCYVVGPCRGHSKLTKEMYISLRPIPKEGTVRCWCLGN